MTTKPPSKWRGISSRIKRAERKILISWIRFSHKHRHSNLLPIALFSLLFLDGFVMVIPSMVCLVAATTISPQRWVLFAFLFAAAATANNALTYVIGRSVSPDLIFSVVTTLAGGEYFLETAREALRNYGSYATFVGALLGLPTQLITALIGIADAQTLNRGLELKSHFLQALTFAFLGHGFKALVMSALTRYGWVKLERKFGNFDKPTNQN